jgi:translation initiation factor IF-1
LRIFSPSRSILAKEEGLRLEGTVQEVLPNATFRVKLDEMDTVVLGVISGKMRQHNIKVMLGDRVEIEFSPYDLKRGRIVRRR